MDFEKKIEKLESIVDQMEKGDLSLEKALSSFEEGVKLSKECSEELEKAEQKVKMLIGLDKNGDAVTQNFEMED
ncbi:MAG: exodeoxyribonuclease VII small subunit [Bdellovibrionota bacterium]|nr:exodeoxyribonuclease VII small subunit [Pseudobdellovibrionaceae bacterium]|tara:strand:+ start:73785 stop:74006 length:222 start_codon:yes stop_codon:yes gene_type:complete